MKWFGKRFARGPERHHDTEIEGLEDWRIVRVSNESMGEAVIRIRVMPPAQSMQQPLSTAIELTWPFQSPNGMPSPDVNKAQLEFDRALDDLSGDNGFSELVQVSTGMGTKEWLFYTADRDKFVASLNGILARLPPFPIEIGSFEDPDWEIWRDSMEAILDRDKSLRDELEQRRSRRNS